MRGDRVRSECWVHGNFDGSYGKAISQLVVRLLHSRHFQSCRSPHCLPVFNRNVSFLSFLAGDREMATLQILHLTTNSTNGKISVSAIIRRHLWRFLVCCDDLRHPRSWFSLTASQPAFWHHSTSSKKQVIFPSSSGSSFPTQLPSDYTHPMTLASPWCIHWMGLEEKNLDHIREILARKRFCRIHKKSSNSHRGSFLFNDRAINFECKNKESYMH